MPINTLPQVAPPPSGGATATSAGKTATGAQTGTDFLAAMLAQFQADGARAQAAPGGDDKAAAGLPQDALPPGGGKPQRKSGIGLDLTANTNVVHLQAWLKANAGKSFMGNAAAQAGDATDSAADAEAPIAAAAKTGADPASATATVVIVDPNAVPALPVVPTTLEASAGAGAAGPDSLGASNPLNANTSPRVAPPYTGPAVAGPPVAASAPAVPEPVSGTVVASPSATAAVPVDADSAVAATVQATVSKAPLGPNLKPKGPHASAAAVTAGAPDADENLQRVNAAVEAPNRSAASIARVASDGDPRALAAAALRAAVAANTPEAAPAASTTDGQAPAAGIGTGDASSGQTGGGQPNAQNGRSYEAAPGLAVAASAAAAQTVDSHLHFTRVVDAVQTLSPSIDHAAGLSANPATAAGAPANVPDADLSKQIVQGMRMQWRDGIGEAKITLKPDYLGDVSVSLRVADGNVTATLHAESPTVRAWIESNEPALRQALAEQGLTLHRLTIAEDSASRGANQDGKDQASQQERQRQQPRQQRRRQDNSQTFESLM